MKVLTNNLEKMLLHQLHNYWSDVNEESVAKAIPNALAAIDENYKGLPNRRFFDGKEVVFSPYMSVQWMNFLYRLSHVLYINTEQTAADQVYYLNKIMHSNDWFYAIDLPTHFHCEHPLGSVLGRAQYGDYFFIYQGTTVGGNRRDGKLFYPQIGNNVIMYANSTVLGDACIGNNVVISANTFIINDSVPDNCIVFGKSPDLVIKEKTKEEIMKYTQHIWGWWK